MPPAESPPPVGPRPAPLALVSITSLVTAVGLGIVALASPGKAGSTSNVFGTVASWISAGGIMGILSLLVWLQLGNRKIRVDEIVAEHADAADIRDHYADEVESLRKRLDEASARYRSSLADIEGKYRRLLHETEAHYRKLLKESETAGEDCKRDREELRGVIGGLKDEIDGLRKQILSQSSDRVLALGGPGADPPSEHVRNAAKRVKRRIANGADSDEDS